MTQVQVANPGPTSGHELDPERLAAYIRDGLDVSGPVTVQDISYIWGSGASNHIAFARIDYGQDTQDWPRDIVIRYSHGTQLMRGKSFDEEFATLQAAARHGIAVPRPLCLDSDGSRLGYPNLIMERLFGDIPAPGAHPMHLLENATPEQSKAMYLEAAAFHGKLRRMALGGDQVPHLIDRGVGSSFVARELSWWHSEMRNHLDASNPRRAYFEKVCAWMLDNEPKHLRPGTLVHGDAQVANLMFQNGKVLAALDWELAHLGYSESDLVFLAAQAKGVNSRHGRPDVASPSANEIITRFEAEAGVSVEYWDYFALFFDMKAGPVMVSKASRSPEGQAAVDRIWPRFQARVDEHWTRAKSG